MFLESLARKKKAIWMVARLTALFLVVYSGQDVFPILCAENRSPMFFHSSNYSVEKKT